MAKCSYSRCGNLHRRISTQRDKYTRARDLDNSTKLITADLTILNKINYAMFLSSPDNVVIGGQQMDDVVVQDGSLKNLNPNVTVAADGSGNYRTINEALSVAASQSDQRFVIYVKKGMYEEIVKVKKDQWNVMMYGDGIGNTIVSGNLHVEEGGITSVAQTATVYFVTGPKDTPPVQ